MEKINVAELLKDCPQGMELDCTMYENTSFIGITERVNFPIRVKINFGNVEEKSWTRELNLTSEGKLGNHPNAKCIIFPKGKTTWEGFHRPFKDGDILATDLGNVFYLSTRLNSDECYGCYVGIGGDGSFHICEPFAYKECCGFATEEEKAKLFKAIKANGYRWNAETKTLEKLPIFKVGDRIRKKGENSTFTITDVNEAHYFCGKYVICDTCDNNWELVPNKFDITTLKPFDKVLVRDDNSHEWVISFFSHRNELKIYKYSCVNSCGYAQCIPYTEDTKHLTGTTNDCDDFYKT